MHLYTRVYCSELLVSLQACISARLAGQRNFLAKGVPASNDEVAQAYYAAQSVLRPRKRRSTS